MFYYIFFYKRNTKFTKTTCNVYVLFFPKQTLVYYPERMLFMHCLYAGQHY